MAFRMGKCNVCGETKMVGDVACLETEKTLCVDCFKRKLRAGEIIRPDEISDEDKAVAREILDRLADIQKGGEKR